MGRYNKANGKIRGERKDCPNLYLDEDYIGDTFNLTLFYEPSAKK